MELPWRYVLVNLSLLSSFCKTKIGLMLPLPTTQSLDLLLLQRWHKILICPFVIGWLSMLGPMLPVPYVFSTEEYEGC